jgi:hypothetical protein
MATERAARTEPSTHAPQRKRRSPVERAIVWAVIIALVLVVAIEARARIGYSRSLSQFEETVLGKQPTLSELRESSIHLWPSESREQRAGRNVIVLKWFSLLHDYRIGLVVPSLEEEDPYVTRFETPGEESSVLNKDLGPAPPVAEEPPPGGAMASAPQNLPPSAGHGMPNPGAAPAGSEPGPAGDQRAAGGNGQRQFPTFEERDQDGDGRLAGDELSDRMKQNLADLDTNQDGALDQEEFDAMRARLRARRQAEGGADGEPARPAGDGDAPAGAGEQPGEAAEQPGDAPLLGGDSPAAP